LSQKASWKNLQTLYLDTDSIAEEAEGAKYLSQNTSWVNLQTLDLSFNSIVDEGAKSLNQNKSSVDKT
jgi:hypothetical protein